MKISLTRSFNTCKKLLEFFTPCDNQIIIKPYFESNCFTDDAQLDLSGLFRMSSICILYIHFAYLFSLKETNFNQYHIIEMYLCEAKPILPSSPYIKSFWVLCFTPNILLQNCK